MPASSSAEQRLQAQAAAHTSWARTADPSARTAPARAALFEKFEREVDPDGTLHPAERARRAEQARIAFYKNLSAKALRARRRAAEANAAAVRHDHEARAAEAALREMEPGQVSA